MMCHGFISAHILYDSDGLSHIRAGKTSGKIRSKETQRKWVARQILALMKSGLTRGRADARLGTGIVELLDAKKFPPGFEGEWFASMLARRGKPAFELLFKGSNGDAFPRKIGADAWFGFKGADQSEVQEQSFPLPNDEIMTLLILPDEALQ
jgi:hypothetical protein